MISSRLAFGVGACAAAVVTLIFATLGDGVDAPSADGVRRMLVDHGHTAVWALLTVALALAAWHEEWSRPARTLASVAGVLYLAFLAAVLL